MYTCVYIYIYIHIHVYIHIHTRAAVRKQRVAGGGGLRTSIAERNRTSQYDITHAL